MDYRSTLQRELEKRSAANPQYSLRAFARDLSISPSRLSEILAKKNGLSPQNAIRLADRMNLKSRDRNQFYLSVCAQHARSKSARNIAQAKLNKIQSSIPKKFLQQDEFQVIADWYHYGIIELLNLKNFNLTTAHVAEVLQIPRLKANEAIQRLKKLGWIRNKNNRWVSMPRYRTFSSQTPSLALRSFHSQLIAKAERAIHGQEISERFLNSLILTVTEEKIPEANQELEDFCYQFNQKFGAKRLHGEKLYALTLQFFKLNAEPTP
jgi:uncharacterized protein (TIGR02147 family)